MAAQHTKFLTLPSKTVSASLSYNGQFASGTEDNAFKGAISIKF